MTKAEIRQALRSRLQRESTLGVRVQDSEIDEFTDDGYGDLAERTSAVVKTVTITVPPDQHFVPLPIDCIHPILLRNVTADTPIDPVDWPYIEKTNTTWIRQSASYPTLYAMWGQAEIMIFPAYSAQGSMELIYAAMPAPLLDGEEPAIPVQHHQALIHYGHWRALLKDAHGDIAGPRLGRARRQKATYLLMAGALEQWGLDRHGVMHIRTYGESLRRHDLEDYPNPPRQP